MTCLAWDPAWGANPPAPWVSGGITITPGFFSCEPGWDCPRWKAEYTTWLRGLKDEWPPD